MSEQHPNSQPTPPEVPEPPQPPSSDQQQWPAVTPGTASLPAPVGPAGPGYPLPFDPEAPYGRDMYGRPYSDKSKIVAGLLQLFLGTFGVGRFYLGDTGLALGQLFTCGGLGIWALIDGIMLLAGNPVDRYGRPLQR